MATTFPSSVPVDRFDSADIARHVADDLGSIFGADRRADESLVDAPATIAVEPPHASRKPLMALIGVGALAIMVAGGLVVGNEATGGTPAPRERVRVASPAPVPAQPVVALTAATPPAPMAEMAAEPVATVEPLAPVARPTLTRERVVPDAERRPLDLLPAPARPFYPAVDETEPTVVVPARRVTCEERGDCPDTALLAADRQVASAYDDAIGAGVRNRDLRDYRAEWIRARSRSAGDPQGALRIYGMVAADLHTLAQDAANRPDVAFR
jgi:hypothetical protein